MCELLIRRLIRGEWWIVGWCFARDLGVGMSVAAAMFPGVPMTELRVSVEV